MVTVVGHKEHKAVACMTTEQTLAKGVPCSWLGYPARLSPLWQASAAEVTRGCYDTVENSTAAELWMRGSNSILVVQIVKGYPQALSW